MSILLSGAKIGALEIKNRIVMPPMCTYKSDESGIVKDFHKTHYSARALGGIGLIIVEATAIEPRGRISDMDLGLWDDSQIDGHKDMVALCHKFGAKMAIQIAHAGRKSEAVSSTPIAPSALSFSEAYKAPIEASLQDIKDVKKAFVSSAVRAQKAGYDAIEIHSAHGYFLFEFLSPLTNLRKDEYGQTLENRCKLVLEVVKEVKENVDLPIIVRISADEWEEGGWGVNDSIYLSKELEKLGANAVHVSAGGNQANPSNAPKFIPLYQCDYAKAIKKEVNIPVIAVGLITTAEEGEALLNGDVCDFVAYGRELLRSPNFAFYAAAIFSENDLIEPSYKRAFL